MRIYLLAVGQRMPDWVAQGFAEYQKRLPRECSLQLKEIAPGRRGKNYSPQKAMEEEADRILAAIPDNCRVWALDEHGKSFSTRQLSQQLDDWLQDGRDLALLVGGPEGLAPRVKQQVEQLWSLSALTLPHPMVRVLLAEQLYRAWTILQNHPYHRE